MRNGTPWLGVLAAVAMHGALPAPARAQEGSTHDVSMAPQAGFTDAKFRLYLPDARRVNGILVMVPGADGDGRGMVKDPRWQKFAAKFNLALLGCSLHGPNYCLAEWGTGDALLDACRQLAQMTQHEELANSPLLLWGFSAGGQFNYHFACWKPQRVLAFVVNKGAYYSTVANAEARAVPGLFFLGEKDAELRIRNITDLYQKGRSLGALWTLVPEPHVAHEPGRSEDMAEAFFEGVLAQRMSPDSPGGLKKADEKAGWLTNLQKKTVAPASSSSWRNAESGWLPDEASAKMWLKVVRPL